MINFIYSRETASSNIASALIHTLGFKKARDFHGMSCHTRTDMMIIEIDGRLVDADFLNGMVEGTSIFLSRHTSSKNIPAFTVHTTGNWTDDTSLGGRPSMLSISSPSKMLDVLKSISKKNNTHIQVTYEATHHGPFMETPSFFVELGGNDDIISSVDHAKMLAEAVADSLDNIAEYEKVAVGLGSTHYPEKFTKLALEGKYAFSHIMSKHYISQINMLEAALERSDRKVEIAVIEWKGIKAADREDILRELDRLGMEYARV